LIPSSKEQEGAEMLWEVGTNRIVCTDRTRYAPDAQEEGEGSNAGEEAVAKEPLHKIQGDHIRHDLNAAP
jgi:hypothetical protein